MIHFACPNCRTVLTAPPERVGAKAGCPKCGQRVQVPAPPPTNKTVLGELVLPTAYPSVPLPVHTAAPDAPEFVPLEVPTPGVSSSSIVPQSFSDEASGMQYVQVSARILKWPTICACCCSQANTTHTVSHTRVTGVEVIRTDERGWSVPYCDTCLRHVSMALDADRRYSEAHRTGVVILVLGLLFGLMSLTGGTCCGSGALGAFVSVPSESSRSPFDPPPPPPKQRREGSPVASGVFSGVMFLAFTGLGLFLLIGGFRWGNQAMTNAQNEHDKQMALAKEAMQAGCCAVYLAAAYNGWSGSIHSFQFWNPQFAAAFRLANAKKVIG